MTASIKSGKEILNEFFAELAEEKELDKKTIDTIVDLFNGGKLSDTHILNELSKLRDDGDDDEDK